MALAGLLLATATVPAWRLASVLVGTLALPGNLDNVMPQFALDPHPLPNNTAPVVSVVDVLLAWAILLTLRDRKAEPRPDRRVLGLALAVAVTGSAAALVTWTSGADLGAVVRGTVQLWRIPAVLWLAGKLVAGPGDTERLATVAVLGLGALFANGAYTTMTTGADRFTAATIGRNGFALTLVLCGLLAAGRLCDARRQGRTGGDRQTQAALGAAVLGAFAGAIATGTRMATVLLVLAAGLATAAWWRGGGRISRSGLVAAGAVLAITIAAGLSVPAGQRAIGMVLDPGRTLQTLVRPASTPEGQPLLARGAYWQLALEMATSHPLTGVGPYQWNIVRYAVDPDTPRVVADAHNTYLQLAAEYGFVVLAWYAILLLAALLVGARWQWRVLTCRGVSWTAVAFAIAALLYAVADLTNSHLFNVRNGLFGWLIIGVAVAAAQPRANGWGQVPPGSMEHGPPVASGRA
jgi:O-antigen ligase